MQQHRLCLGVDITRFSFMKILYGMAYTHVTEYRNNLSLMKRFLEPMFEGVILDPFRQAHYFKALKTLREYEPRSFSLATI